VRLAQLIAATACVGILTCGCLGRSSGSPAHAAAKGTIQGRVSTNACGITTCDRTSYRGFLTFCRTMGQIGPCPSARVDAGGRYRIKLLAGRYALVPAPGRGDTVVVTPRWVSVGPGATRTLDINGGSLTD
jgi:hypothetical protein